MVLSITPLVLKGGQGAYRKVMAITSGVNTVSERSSHWQLQTIVSQTGANPFDCSDAVNATQLRFGELSRPQQVMGIGYLYVERALAQRDAAGFSQ